MKKITTFLLLQFLLSWVHTGLEAQDVPTTTQNILTGRYRQVQSGISFFPDLTSNTFTVNLPTCSGGGTPTIAYAYLNWQGRYRNLTSAPLPTFDQNVNVQINSSAVTDVAASFFPVGSGTQGSSDGATTRRHFTGFADVTTFVQNNINAGSNTISITDFDRPTSNPPLNPTSNWYYNQNFGVGLTIVYECSDFPLSTITVGAGADFFLCRAPAATIGAYSELTVFTFPATTTEVTGRLKGMFGGQENTVAPFRGGNICYVVGSGTPPATTMDPPDPVVVNDPNVICTTNPTWVSALGQEWDSLNVAVTIPAGSTYLVIQAQSSEGVPGVANCGSLLTSTFSLEVPGNLFCPNPTATAATIPASCTEGSVNPNTASLQISAATDATHYNFVAGDDYEINGGQIDIANATAFNPATDLPLTFGNLPNPAVAQDYTIRIFNGNSDCFTDVTVTLNNQDCTDGYDLALAKTITAGNNGGDLDFEAGDEVTFTFTVTNQGTRTAYDIDVTDYIPAGLTNPTLASGTPSGTTQTGSTANTVTYTIDQLNGSDDGGATEVSFDVTFMIPNDYMLTSITNTAEISRFFRDGAGTLPAEDEDSTPDDDDMTNGGETEGSDLEDNNITEDGKNGGDEDDHDIETITVTPAPIDFGDLPNTGVGTTYNTTTADGGPRHVIIDDLRIGLTIDGEMDGQPSYNADGDDMMNPDDEDGVSFPDVFYPGRTGATINVEVTNANNTNATLYAFIDWDGDGDFDDTGEIISGDASGTGTIMLDVDVPAGANTLKPLGARFRLFDNTDGNFGQPNGLATAGGEVEDYLISVRPCPSGNCN